MRNRTKALISAAAGFALLAGTSGTLAEWRDTADVTVSDLQIGDLSLTFAGNQVGEYKQVLWTLRNASNVVVGGPTYDFGYLPKVGAGYTLTGTTQIRTTLIGATIVANLRGRELTSSYEATSPDLATFMQEARDNSSVVITNGGVTLNEDTDLVAGIEIHDLKITVDFPAELPAGTQIPQTAWLHLGDLDLELIQVVRR